MTPLDKTLKRGLKIKGEDFVLTLTPAALKVTRKGHRQGIELLWESLISGERALALALQASVGQFATAPPGRGQRRAPPISATRSREPAGAPQRKR